jgi:hypothetical protein
MKASPARRLGRFRIVRHQWAISCGTGRRDARRWPLSYPRGSLEHGRKAHFLRRFRQSQTSAFFFVPDLAIDEIADIVAILFLFLEKCIVAGFNLDIVVRRGRDSVLACIGFLKRNQLRYRPRLAFILIGHRRALGHARERRGLNNGPAFWACDGRFVEIEETHAAVLAFVLVTEFRFGHRTYLFEGTTFRPG